MNLAHLTAIELGTLFACFAAGFTLGWIVKHYQRAFQREKPRPLR